MATSDTGHHASTLDPEGEVARAMEIASDLCLVEDPPGEPFQSKYKARDVLIKAKQARQAASGSAAVRMGLWLVGGGGGSWSGPGFATRVCVGYLEKYAAPTRVTTPHFSDFSQSTAVIRTPNITLQIEREARIFQIFLSKRRGCCHMRRYAR